MPWDKERSPFRYVDASRFNEHLVLPYGLHEGDFHMASAAVYRLMTSVNDEMQRLGLARLEQVFGRSGFNGLLARVFATGLARPSSAPVRNELVTNELIRNGFYNGRPILVRQGQYRNNAVTDGRHGVEIQVTRELESVSLAHPRDTWLCVVRWDIPRDGYFPYLRIVEMFLTCVTKHDLRRPVVAIAALEGGALAHQGSRSCVRIGSIAIRSVLPGRGITHGLLPLGVQSMRWVPATFRAAQ
jgi:hypothetical protein